MRALVIEHDAFSPIGPVGDRLVQHGFEVAELVVVPPERHLDPGVEITFPDPSGWDLVVTMGAPWSVDDEAAIGSWIADELAMLRKAQGIGVPVLGICFGGQALAAALGGGVERAPRPEIGWGGVETAEPSLVGPGPWFQYHYDRWIMPPGGVEIARNEVAPQAFRIGRSLGVQFHPEITVRELESWLANGGEKDMRRLGLDPGSVLDQTRALAPAAERRAHRFMDAFLRHAGLL
ncbi:type 1 glutamine amidotransferase [Actinomadura sp. 6K520]|jgi:GMP synthase-like glutamine amidotransferase|uniref:type 1 glutamine amidotransferase n=1 Tax=Actinomadura sp. 6K520 TaxID=2530364 RepID=UPI00104E74D5|nr:type 1 glutamine amidotransferase [Actinomadura sp. 6K520]TDE21949.1 type 1 glutamine amidotransferase [Actinomadura sp. 6K520]